MVQASSPSDKPAICRRIPKQARRLRTDLVVVVSSTRLPQTVLTLVTKALFRRRDALSPRRAVHAVQTLWIQRQRKLVGGEGGGGLLLFHQQISQQLVCGNGWGGGDGVLGSGGF